MRIVTYLTAANEVDTLVSCKVKDAIIPIDRISRVGTVSASEGKKLAKVCVEKGIRPILEWDILMVESEFQTFSKEVTDLLNSSEFKCVRTYDPGSTNYLLEKHPEVSLQLLLEIGNHNLKSIEGWVDIAGDRLDRLVLSQEISEEVLKEYISKLNIPVEFYGLGRLLLAYTPRKLLSKQFSFTGPIEVRINSLESPHSNMPVVQNQHGTFTFYMRDLGLVDYLDRIAEIGVDSLRVDLRHLNMTELLPKLYGLLENFSQESAASFNDAYPVELFKGFFGKNKSDSVFSKLKNKKIQRIDENYVGEVIDVAKKEYMGIMIKSSSAVIENGMELEIRTPEGRTKHCKVHHLKDSCGNPIESATQGKVFYLSHVSGVSVKSAIFQMSK